jgi:hypothetical protein
MKRKTINGASPSAKGAFEDRLGVAPATNGPQLGVQTGVKINVSQHLYVLLTEVARHRKTNVDALVDEVLSNFLRG